jgi:hypothetical protein
MTIPADRAFPIRKPDLAAGDFIDTGRYRPAEMLSIDTDAPHRMSISYGDEIDENFRPHITPWRKVPRPEVFPSLKDVFEAGDWILLDYGGYGQVRAVCNTTLIIALEKGERIYAPPSDLRGFRKLDGAPPPRDPRPASIRFPIGSWVRQGHFGEALVLGHKVAHPQEFHPTSPFDNDVECLGLLFDTLSSSAVRAR